MNKDILKKVKLWELPKPAKLYVTMFLLVMGCGYLMALLNINTSMGLLRETYTPGETITYEFGGSSYENIVKHYRGSVEDPAAYPGMDLAAMTSTSHTHFIAMGVMVFCLGLPFLFTVTLPEWLKKFVLVDSFVAVIIAVLSFWAIKYVAPQMAVLMMFSGMLLGFCMLFEIAVPFYEMWLYRECECPAPEVRAEPAPVKAEAVKDAVAAAVAEAAAPAKPAAPADEKSAA
ncbi:MAG: hypothetical protein CVU79_10205 [Elusimicrobia bacterium HGW-Elusimicrobia-3]|jgi:hypothetical protein|nr:MAG: hypothetical protein CVU79_10205 [Elusimicrobia bacterium HGW-Elusimicrobia-3]